MAASQALFLGHYQGSNLPASFKCYLASSGAVNTFLPMAQFRDAASTDPVDIYPPGNMIIDDIQSSATGVIRLYSMGQPTAVLIDLGSRANTNSGRNINLNIPLGAGKVYRWIVETQLSA